MRQRLGLRRRKLLYADLRAGHLRWRWLRWKLLLRERLGLPLRQLLHADLRAGELRRQRLRWNVLVRERLGLPRERHLLSAQHEHLRP